MWSSHKISDTGEDEELTAVAEDEEHAAVAIAANAGDFEDTDLDTRVTRVCPAVCRLCNDLFDITR